MTLQPQFDRTGPVPIYLQIKEWIRQQIVSGLWPTHYKLQAETDLAEGLEVSRGTIRKAIAELTEEGLLLRTHGRGTFVAANVLEQSLGNNMVTFSEDLISKGIPFETTVLAKRIIQVDPTLATRLQTTADTSAYFFLKRIRCIEDEPVVLSHNYVRYDICPGIEVLDFQRLRLFEVLELHYALHLERGRRTFQAQQADEAIATRLELEPNSAIMYLEQETYVDDGSLVEFSEVWLKGSIFKLTADMRRGGVHATVVSDSTMLTVENIETLA